MLSPFDQAARATRQAAMIRRDASAPVPGYARITTPAGFAPGQTMTETHERFTPAPMTNPMNEVNAGIEDERSQMLKAPMLEPIRRAQAETGAIEAGSGLISAQARQADANTQGVAKDNTSLQGQVKAGGAKYDADMKAFQKRYDDLNTQMTRRIGDLETRLQQALGRLEQAGNRPQQGQPPRRTNAPALNQTTGRNIIAAAGQISPGLDEAKNNPRWNTVGGGTGSPSAGEQPGGFSGQIGVASSGKTYQHYATGPNGQRVGTNDGVNWEPVEPAQNPAMSQPVGVLQ